MTDTINTHNTHTTAERLQDGRRVLEALQGAETGPDTEGIECVYARTIGGMFFAIDDHGCGSFFRAPDADGHMELVKLSPRETLCLSAFWRMIAYEEICLALEERKRTDEAAKQDSLRAVEAQPQARRAARNVEVYTAPSLEASSLTNAPRIRRDAEGFQRLQTQGVDGWNTGDVVEEVVRLERWGVVLVATDDGAYLMPAAEYDTPPA